MPQYLTLFKALLGKHLKMSRWVKYHSLCMRTLLTMSWLYFVAFRRLVQSETYFERLCFGLFICFWNSLSKPVFLLWQNRSHFILKCNSSSSGLQQRMFPSFSHLVYISLISFAGMLCSLVSRKQIMSNP